MTAFSKKGNLSPEGWLKEEAYWQLEKIVGALNASHTLPFKCTWLEMNLGRYYFEMLKGMESILLIIWSQLNGNISEIEHQVLVWYGRQKRSQNNILSSYYLFQENLTEWASSSKAMSYGLSDKWSDYLLFVMAIEKNHLTRSSSGNISILDSEREALAILFLSKMQKIYIAEPHQLCIDFFTFISSFTQDSVHFPTRVEKEIKQTKFVSLNKFRREMKKSDQWSLLCRLYLDTVDEITRKKNDLQE